jgi:macrolide-specific efflux system membrane fusion protein
MVTAWVARVRRRPVPAVNAALGILAAVCAWLGYTTVWGGADASAQATSAGPVVAVSQGAVVDTVSAAGTVESASTAGATFATSGTVTEIDVAVGDAVRKGQVLAKVDASAALC